MIKKIAIDLFDCKSIVIWDIKRRCSGDQKHLRGTCDISILFIDIVRIEREYKNFQIHRHTDNFLFPPKPQVQKEPDAS